MAKIYTDDIMWMALSSSVATDGAIRQFLHQLLSLCLAFMK